MKIPKTNQHFYDTDIWSIAASRINDALMDGMTLYCELVGQTHSGKWIQERI